MNSNSSQQEESLNNKKKLPNKKARRQKRKRINKLSRKEFKRNAKFTQTMSTWAETFTLASNWQIKHQLAFWKARAKSLEYENSILHDIIRKNYLPSSSNPESNEDESHSNSNPIKHETKLEMENDCDEDETEYDEQYPECAEEENEDFVVSEEFIEFLRINAKYKEDARLERERLKAKQAQEEIEEKIPEVKFTSHERLKELYGDKWQRISALQMSLMTDFMNITDECQPVYWPNIPFNFNYS